MIRFSLLKNNEEYFSHENEVFLKWTEEINKALNSNEIENIYVDATHLNDKSRKKTLNALNKTNIKEVINVVFDVPLEICLERNAQRTGRELVPEEIIYRMKKSFHLPKYNSTIILNEKGEKIWETFG